MVGTVGKFMSATHIGIASKPAFGGAGEKPSPFRPSTAMASLPRRSRMEVKSYFISALLLKNFVWPHLNTFGSRMQPPAGKLKKSCGKITNFYDKKEPSGPEVNPKSQTKISNIAIFKMKAHIHVDGTNRNCPADFSPPLHGATSYYPSRGRRHVLFFIAYLPLKMCASGRRVKHFLGR